MTLIEAVGKRVENLLQVRKMTQYKLYKDGGIPRPTISTIIHAKNKTIQLDTIYQIATTLGLSLNNFFDDAIFELVND